MSRVKARLKFMVDDIGVDGMRERVEAKLGRTLERFDAAADRRRSRRAHVGVHAQKQDGLSYIGVPVQLGLTSGDQLIAVADLAESLGGDIRLTRQQNLIVTGVPNERVDEALAELDATRPAARRRTRSGRTRSPAPASRTATSPSARRSRASARLSSTSRRRSATTIADLRLHLDGCPHACAQHWVGDLGFQATTGKDDDGNARLGVRHLRARLARPRRADRPARSSAASRASELDARGRGPRRAAGSTAARERRELHGVPAPPVRRRARRPRRPRAREETRTRGGEHEHVRAVRRAGGRRALGPVRGRGAAGAARVGDRASSRRASRSRPRSRSTTSR